MNKKLLFVGLFSLFCLISITSFSQLDKPTKQIVKPTFNYSEFSLSAPNMEAIKIEDALRDKNGMFYRIGVLTDVNINPMNQGQWSTLPTGDKVWGLKIKQAGAEALSFYFDLFKLYDGSTFEVIDENGNALFEKQTQFGNLEHGQKLLELCAGDEMILRLFEPKNARRSEIQMNHIGYGYRSTGKAKVKKDFGDSESCQVNINCTAGSQWQDEKKGVARILVSSPAGQGWCTGSLVNNAKKDCKPYFLTALHCAVNSNNQIITAAYFNQWKFYFNYEATGCTSPSSGTSLTNSNNRIDGCVMLANSNDGGGNSGSDFLLVQLGTINTEASIITKLKSSAIGAYWNGWDANNTSVSSGAGIHHPSGDIKKISTYSSSLVSSTWSNVSNTHWRVTWSANANGHGVTEGGSSGSPIFNTSGNSRIIGTLTGGSSYCNALTSPDLYGKMSYHWISNGSNSTYRLKTYLDPNNSGILVLDGSYNPCNSSGGTGETTYCEATSSACTYEFISNVTLGTINNPTACNNYTNYSNLQATVVRGQTYTMQVTTSLTNSSGAIQQGAYTDDEIAAWVDWNNDNDFNDAGERIGYIKVATGFSLPINFSFTVPANATIGNHKMRVRISYLPDEGAINPCGTTQDGEVEDYVLVVKASSVSIDEIDALNNITLYPNPTSNELNIDLSSLISNENVTIQLLDLTGKLLINRTYNNTDKVQLNMNLLSEGLYQVKITQGTNSLVKKITKM